MILLTDLRRRILGDLVVDGYVTIVDTLTTDQIVVTNANAGTALQVNQQGALPIADFQSNGASVLTVAGNRVTVSTPVTATSIAVDSLTVSGASGILKASAGLVSSGAIMDADISTSAQIDWSKINKSASSISDLGEPTVVVSFGGQRLTELSNPLEDTDATNKAWVNSRLASLSLASFSDLEVAAPSNAQLLIYHGGSWTNRSISGAVTFDSYGTALLTEEFITDAHISPSAIISFAKLAPTNSSSVIVSDESGRLAPSGVTVLELNSLQGVTASLQEQLDSKQPLGDYMSFLEGDVVADSSGQTTIADATVTSKLLVNLAPSSGDVSSADSILSSIGKLTYSKHDPVTIGTSHGLTLVEQRLSLSAAGPSSTGALLVTDWNIFNNKEPAITTLPTAKGGTGNSEIDLVAGSLVYTDGSKFTSLPLGESGQILSVNDGALEWSDLLAAKAFSDSTRPIASSVRVGTVIFNTDDNTLNVSDGYAWRDMSGSLT